MKKDGGINTQNKRNNIRILQWLRAYAKALNTLSIRIPVIPELGIYGIMV